MDTLLPLRPSATRRVQGIDHLVPPSQERLYAAGRGVVRGPFEVLVEHVLKDGLVWVGAREERHGRLQLLGIDRAEDLDRVRRLEPKVPAASCASTKRWRSNRFTRPSVCPAIVGPKGPTMGCVWRLRPASPAVGRTQVTARTMATPRRR